MISLSPTKNYDKLAKTLRGICNVKGTPRN